MVRVALSLVVAVLLFGSAFCEDKTVFSAAASATPNAPAILFEPFREGWIENWVNSTESKYDGEWHWAGDYSDVKGDFGAKMASAGKLHAMARSIKDGIEFGDKPLVIQYEVKAANGLSCDGQYIKLLHAVKGGLSKFNSNSRYTIMFGPDKCGSTDKVHFIVQYKNPVSKKWEEKHAKAVPVTAGSDKLTHLYTLIVRPDNSFEIFVDSVSKLKGSLLKDLEPPINPSKEIDDPTDHKPEDWVDYEHMDDPKAVKPDNWNEDAPEMIEDEKAVKPSDWDEDAKDMVPDPNAVKPSDWDDDEDGAWEAPLVPNPKCKKSGCGAWKRPMIKNPDYKGKWYPPRIPNPDYKGPWKARQIANPHFFEDPNPFKSLRKIDSVAIELLTVSGDIVFDNLLITTSEASAKDFAKATWAVRNKAEAASSGKATDFVSTMKVFGDRAYKTAQKLYQDQPIPMIILGGLTLIVLIVLIFSCCSGGGSPPPQALNPKKTDAAVSDDDDADGSEGSSEAEEEVPRGRGGKTAAKAVADEPVAAGANPSPKKRSSRKD